MKSLKLKDLLSNDYFKLFIRREGKVVLGNHNSNLWLLTAVLSATFLAIAFSNGSLKYLEYKMDDPFTQWVDIKNDYSKGALFSEMRDALKDEDLKEKYHFSGFQEDYYFSYLFFGKEDTQLQLLRCRFFESIKSPLVKEILKPGNVIDKCRVENVDDLDDYNIGVIITESTLKNLGYSKAPAYIDLCRYATDESLGMHLVNERARVPLPLLGVVERLPGNVDLISSRYCYEQENNDNTYPFLMDNETYATSLLYYVPDDASPDSFASRVESLLNDHGMEGEFDVSVGTFYKPEIIPYKSGKFVGVEPYDDLPLSVVIETNDAILAEYAGKDVHRVFDYDFSDYRISESTYMSVNFTDLNNISDFEKMVREKYNVNIEMTQINAKENFNSVRLMANILSWAMIAFAIVCVILFIVNLFQSYFQKVKRNLGTFKAFGISNRELISIYSLIMFAIVLASIIISLTFAFFIQLILPAFGIMKEGMFNYLSLWNAKTIISVIIIMMISIYTVYKVMSKLLKLTPGDLIYDRQ